MFVIHSTYSYSYMVYVCGMPIMYSSNQLSATYTTSVFITDDICTFANYMRLSTLPHNLEMRNVFVWTQQLASIVLSIPIVSFHGILSTNFIRNNVEIEGAFLNFFCVVSFVRCVIVAAAAAVACIDLTEVSSGRYGF